MVLFFLFVNIAEYYRYTEGKTKTIDKSSAIPIKIHGDKNDSEIHARILKNIQKLLEKKTNKKKFLCLVINIFTKYKTNVIRKL